MELQISRWRGILSGLRDALHPGVTQVTPAVTEVTPAAQAGGQAARAVRPSAQSFGPQGSRLSRVAARFPFITSGFFVATTFGLVVVIGTGLYLNSRNTELRESIAAGGDPSPTEIAVRIGQAPAPEGTRAGDCARGVALDYGLIWTERGWRAPGTGSGQEGDGDPEPEQSRDKDGNPWDEADYLAAHLDWQSRINERVATAMAEIQAVCGTAAIPGLVPNDAAGPVSIFALENVSGGTLWIGPESTLENALACNFSGGGICTDGNAGNDNPAVVYSELAGQFEDLSAAHEAFCLEISGQTADARPLTGGSKVEVFGRVLWDDYAPSCT